MAAAVCMSATLGLSACGSGPRQDASEPNGTFKVDVTRATFPDKQRLAEPTQLVIAVRNPGPKTMPNVAVTVQSGESSSPDAEAFAETSQQQGLANSSRPVWILDDGPRGGITAYTNTWALGPLKPGQTKTFVWHVTAIKSGVHSLKYTVAAGLNGNAKAQLAGGQVPAGSFTTSIANKPANATVGPNGNVITPAP